MQGVWLATGNKINVTVRQEIIDTESGELAVVSGEGSW